MSVYNVKIEELKIGDIVWVKYFNRMLKILAIHNELDMVSGELLKVKYPNSNELKLISIPVNWLKHKRSN